MFVELFSMDDIVYHLLYLITYILEL